MGLFSSVGKFLGLGGSESSGTQTSTVRAAPRTSEAKRLWEKFMADIEKLPATYAEQEAALRPKVEEYTGLLRNLVAGGGEPGRDYYRQYGISLGGSSPIMFTPRSNIAAAESLAKLGGLKLGTEGQYAPGWSRQAFLDYITPILMQTEAMRYKIPSTTTTATARDWSGAQLLSDLGNLGTLGMSALNFFKG